MQSIRIYEMPACRMVSSGTGMFGEGKFRRFEEWLSAQKRSMFPRDFLYGTNGGFVWLYMLEAGMEAPPEFDCLDFPGGLYAAAADIDGKTDRAAMNAAVDLFLEENGFVRDASRAELGNIITSPGAQKILGYEQMEYYFPVKAKDM